MGGLSQFGLYGENGLGWKGGAGFPGVAPMHSPTVVGIFPLVNAGLTALQLLWLKEIVDQTLVFLKGGSSPACPRTVTPWSTSPRSNEAQLVEASAQGPGRPLKHAPSRQRVPQLCPWGYCG